jgi:hypothetical protein
MAFGRLRAKRKKREERQGREADELKRREKDADYERQRDEMNAEAQRRFDAGGKTAEERLSKDKERMDTDRSAARQYAEELLNRDVQGLSPQRRKQMEDQANFSMSRDLQNAERKLISSQGRRGMRGGIAYAQRADLARMGQEGRAGIQSDLNRLDADSRNKNMAAMIAMEQGERGLMSSQYDRARAEIAAEDSRRQNQLALEALLRRYGAQ